MVCDVVNKELDAKVPKLSEPLFKRKWICTKYLGSLQYLQYSTYLGTLPKVPTVPAYLILGTPYLTIGHMNRGRIG